MNGFTVSLLKAFTPDDEKVIFTRSVLNKLVQEMQPQLKNKTLCGEITVPFEKRFSQQLSVDPDRVSHRITELFVNGDELKATVEVLNTPYGFCLREFMKDHDVKFKMRGIPVFSKAPGVLKVVEQYNLVAVDADTINCI